MVCVKCGHDNPRTAKFCNECGALFDRRKGERRQGDRRQASVRTIPQEDVTSSLLPSHAPGQESTQEDAPGTDTAEASSRADRPFRGPGQILPVEDVREKVEPLRAQSLSRAEISGPSFLGLSGGSADSGDYLLEDEPSSRGRKWVVLLLLIFVSLLGYLQWKSSRRAQPAAPAPMQSAPGPAGPQGSAEPASEGTGTATSQQATKRSDSTNPPTGKESTATSSRDKPKSDAAVAGRSTTASDSQPDPMLFMAKKYLYGQGVRRDCDQAMVYLRAANQKASAPARSQMGALYAAGYCLPLDRVRAYQWFTSALNIEPGNPNPQRERNNLWAQMSSDERQKAVK